MKKILFVILLAIITIVVLFFIQSLKGDPGIQHQEEQTGSILGNPSLDKAVTEFLLSKEQFAWKSQEGSINFCVFQNLNTEESLFPYYIKIRCGEFKMVGRELKELSGVASLPVKIDYPNELSYYDISKFTLEVPRDGSLYYEDIKRIFPEDIQANLSLQRPDLNEKILETAQTFFWGKVKQAVVNCEVERVGQSHGRYVWAKLKNGGELDAIEPGIDDIITAIKSVEGECGTVPIATE